MHVGNLLIDRETLSIRIPGTDLAKECTLREFQILEFLSNHQNQAVLFSDLIEKVFPVGDFYAKRTTEVYLNMLRKVLCWDGGHFINIIKKDNIISLTVSPIAAERPTV